MHMYEIRQTAIAISDNANDDERKDAGDPEAPCASPSPCLIWRRLRDHGDVAVWSIVVLFLSCSNCAPLFVVHYYFTSLITGYNPRL
jgi:hypothetical protein